MFIVALTIHWVPFQVKPLNPQEPVPIIKLNLVVLVLKTVVVEN
jgi:hypothetical protein